MIVTGYVVYYICIYLYCTRFLEGGPPQIKFVGQGPVTDSSLYLP